MGMAKCTGMMAVTTKGSGKKDYRMGKAYYMCQSKGLKKDSLRTTF